MIVGRSETRESGNSRTPASRRRRMGLLGRIRRRPDRPRFEGVEDLSLLIQVKYSQQGTQTDDS
ncbi:hypothetical protein Pla22_30650 [Rubripirellula amarantea]|uniref:Uncharacterized protein n=1 Tax=Rubripirellula amarantea TaxID=2527999 RepID=A0A5C5WK31_9BACT|nr:hypothetical protein Pla22_30650 [Rubripirellula amarantea]